MKHPRYLTSEQALADYAELLQWYQSSAQFPLPVVCFGGSYGGMLSAWFRMKYPNMVVGALASSAPILQFDGLAGYNPNLYNQIIYNDYAQQSTTCAVTIQAAFPIIAQLAAQGDSGLQEISSNLGLCGTLTQKDVPVLNNFLNAGLSYMAMTDYPGPSDFLQPMPSYPVNVACAQLATVLNGTTSPSDPQVLQALRAVVGVYYNWTGSQPCFEISSTASSNLGMSAWDIQACTEMIFPINSGGLFPPSSFNLDAYVAECRLANLVARPHWVGLNYQSNQIAIRNVNASQPTAPLGFSNVIFSNGELDPWRSGGVVTSLSDSVIAIVIPQAAHHLDLRFASPYDPQPVTDARTLETKIITGWIEQYYSSFQN